jgi:hypothetical protein
VAWSTRKSVDWKGHPFRWYVSITSFSPFAWMFFVNVEVFWWTQFAHDASRHWRSVLSFIFFRRFESCHDIFCNAPPPFVPLICESRCRPWKSVGPTVQTAARLEDLYCLSDSELFIWLKHILSKLPHINLLEWFCKTHANFSHPSRDTSHPAV